MVESLGLVRKSTVTKFCNKLSFHCSNFSYSTTVQFWRCCYVIQQMALLHSTAVLHFICSTRLLAETTPSVGFQNPIFVWREAQKTLLLLMAVSPKPIHTHLKHGYDSLILILCQCYSRCRVIKAHIHSNYVPSSTLSLNNCQSPFVVCAIKYIIHRLHSNQA